MRVFATLVSVFLLLCLIVPVGAGLYGYRAWQGPGPLNAPKDIIIARGAGVGGIADQLAAEGVIASSTVFKIAARLTAAQAQLKAGEYEFAPHIAMREVVAKLAKGDIVDRKITIPEGRSSWQIVALLRQTPALSGAIKTVPEDGSLLPETYAYVRDQDRNSVIAAMQAAMTKAVNGLWPGRDKDLPFETKLQALTLASIVEKETGIAGERPRIAGVFINRLKAGMPLQSDPTVIYAMTGGHVQDEGQGPLGRHLLRKDLEDTNSPYNTYKYPGLPPGPIANPGRDAIAAVLHPEKNDFLYFVANGSGGHVFASTLAEHERNVQEWRTIRKRQGN